MGQKIHPTGFRLPVTRNWASRWYANNQNFATMLAEDLDDPARFQDWLLVCHRGPSLPRNCPPIRQIKQFRRAKPLSFARRHLGEET